MKAMASEKNYQKEARDFLLKWNLEMEVRFLKKGKHFPEDKEERNIFWFRIVRVGVGLPRPEMEGRFGCSVRSTLDNKRPSAYDILACLTKYDPGTHENFCSEYGYDEDSIRGMETYRAVSKEYKDLIQVIPPEAMEEFRDIQ